MLEKSLLLFKENCEKINCNKITGILFLCILCSYTVFYSYSIEPDFTFAKRKRFNVAFPSFGKGTTRYHIMFVSQG